MKSTDMLALLREFHRDKFVMRQRHAAAAQHVTHYDFNNTYQYVIAREDMHLRWLSDAIADLGGQTDESAVGNGDAAEKGRDVQRALITRDRDEAEHLMQKWRARVNTLPNARHRTMLNVILGETLEHLRFFELALAGRSDLLGRRADGAGTGGGVLPTRWVGSDKS